jgi:hypothetical protein
MLPMQALIRPIDAPARASSARTGVAVLRES